MSDDASNTGAPTNLRSSGHSPMVGIADYEEALRLLPPGLRSILPELGMSARWVDDRTCWWWTVEDERVHYWSLSAQELSPTALFSRSISDPRMDEVLEVHGTWVRASNTNGIVHIDRRTGLATPDVSAAPVARVAGMDADVPGELPPPRVPSPDGRWIAERSGWDIVVRSAASGDVHLTTLTGTPEQPFGDLRGTVWSGDVSWRRAHGDWPPQVSWSADSRWLITTHTDLSSVTVLPLLDSAGVDGAKPCVESFPCPLPGEEHPTVRLVALDIERREIVDPGVPTMSAISPILQQGRAWWTADGSTLFVLELGRRTQDVRIWRWDPELGPARPLVHLHDEPFGPYAHWPSLGGLARTTSHGDRLVMVSESTGWAHLESYDGVTGAHLATLTSGDWVVSNIVDVDDDGVLFLAQGRGDGDPYLRRLHHVDWSGERLAVLTPADADHNVRPNRDGSLLLCRASRVDMAPVTTMIDRHGRTVAVVHRLDDGPLRDLGIPPAIRLGRPGADGTVIWSTLQPACGTPAGTVPLVDITYGGPAHTVAPVEFDDAVGGWSGSLALARLGIATIRIDGSGTPGRSAAFHRRGFGPGFSDLGLSDHVAVIHSLRADGYKVDRVGVMGHSGGGYSSTRAMLLHPDVFTVGVSSAGCHDARLLRASWGEDYLGEPADDPALWVEQSNASLASRLRGSLLLVHGELDDDVHPVATQQLVRALADAGKSFTTVLLPGVNHLSLLSDPWFQRLRWDHLLTHLVGAEVPRWNEVDWPALLVRAGWTDSRG